MHLMKDNYIPHHAEYGVMTLGTEIISPIFFIETATARCHYELITCFVYYKLTNNTMGSNLMGRQHIAEISIMQMLHKFFSDGMFS